MNTHANSEDCTYGESKGKRTCAMAPSKREFGRRLEGRVGVVTGAGDGIGRGIAEKFAEHGAKVGVCDLAAEALAQTAERCRALGAPVHAEAFDLRDGKRIISFVDAVAQALGGIDVLVNNAAVMPVARVEQQTDEEVDAILAVNLRAPILMSRAVTAHMRRRAGGSIIHISSVTGWQGHAGVVVYGTTKAALVGLARGQAVELGADGIRVNTVSPGTIDSPMLHRFLAEQTTDPAASRKAFDALHIRGICGSIEDVAFGCLFLASDESLNVTGSDLRCDGGYTVMATQPR